MVTLAPAVSVLYSRAPPVCATPRIWSAVPIEVRPVPPPLVGTVGRSAATIERSPTAPDEPLGVASTWLAVSPVVAETASVPLPVRGELLTVSQDGVDKPTEVRPPPLAVEAMVIDPAA